MKKTNSIIKLEGIDKAYKTGDEDTVALSGVDLEIASGEFVAIMGPSGSGKSSLMHILGLLDKPTAGRYYLDNEDVSTLSVNRQAEIRNQKIGFVFQQFNLLPRTSVLDNVLLPTIYGGRTDPEKTARTLIEKVNLSDRINNRSNQLSGGQIQRVAIARALIMDPAIVLADEPTGNLDTKRSREIMELFQEINREGATVVVITHEPDIARYARRVIKLQDGKVVSDEAREA